MKNTHQLKILLDRAFIESQISTRPAGDINYLFLPSFVDFSLSLTISIFQVRSVRPWFVKLLGFNTRLILSA